MPDTEAQHQNEHNTHNQRLLAARQLKHGENDKPNRTRRKTRDAQNSSPRKKRKSHCRVDATARVGFHSALMSKDASATRMEKIVSLCKRRGFIFQSSEIYGGLNGFWDYGPLGVELKKNLKDFWWRRNVRERDDMEGMDG